MIASGKVDHSIESLPSSGMVIGQHRHSAWSCALLVLLFLICISISSLGDVSPYSMYIFMRLSLSGADRSVISDSSLRVGMRCNLIQITSHLTPATASLLSVRSRLASRSSASVIHGGGAFHVKKKIFANATWMSFDCQRPVGGQ